MREQAMGLMFRRKTFQGEELANSLHLTLKSSTRGSNSVIFFFHFFLSPRASQGGTSGKEAIS